ncbi:hypothetical protein [Azomonas macrocytogenes]|uniref:Integrase n=1 Tax=Azomonas macrocytogenes TaxID=69962 RepID=A0A839TBL6_AZOMA|nr:hypothetical protein [Azomonas macrocytogenes]MBB3105455.1 integrase [Azomonas macrocytogenes]
MFISTARSQPGNAPFLRQLYRVEEEGLLRVADGYPRPTVHDLRRTATTHMSSQGLSKEVCSRILNHKDLSADAVYDYAYFDEKAGVLMEWHGFLKGLLRREFGDVDWIELHGRRMEDMAVEEDFDD